MMSNICDKITTCAQEAQASADEDDDFESDMFQSLEVASHYAPKRESNDDDEETSLSDESTMFQPKASTPKWAYVFVLIFTFGALPQSYPFDFRSAFYRQQIWVDFTSENFPFHLYRWLQKAFVIQKPAQNSCPALPSK